MSLLSNSGEHARALLTFDLTLARPDAFDATAFLDLVEHPLFEAFEGDVMPAVSNGVPCLACTVEAETMEAAVNRVVPLIAALGFPTTRAGFPIPL